MRFTQFLRPHGRTRLIDLDRPRAVEAKAQALLARGCHFDIEELSTGAIHMTIELDTLDDPVIAVQLCKNTVAVLAAVDRLVDEATRFFEQHADLSSFLTRKEG